MTGYMPAQSLLKSLLITCSSLGTGRVVEGDDRILDTGGTNAAILYPGAMQRYELAQMHRENEYTAKVDLFTKYVSDASYGAFGTLRDAVLATIAGGRCLSEAYFITGVTGGEVLEVYEMVNGQRMGPFFLTEELQITIVENV